MKKWMSLLMAVCMAALMSAPACAEAGPAALEVGRITQIFSGTPIDLDADGDQEAIGFEILKDDEGYDVGFRLNVGESTVEGEGWTLNEDLYALRLNQYDSLLMVSDFGPSDDYETFFYLYAEDELTYVGSIYALPDSMTVSGEVITATVRGNLLYTWFHEADFSLADYWGENSDRTGCIYQIPRYLYPMGLKAKLKVELPLAVSMTNPETACVLESGSHVVLCATDDVEWVYIQSAEGFESGWMRAGGEYGMECYVDGKTMFSWDVFDDLLFAD